MIPRLELQRYLPILGWLRSYDRSTLAGDLVAALIVTIMLIPQSLAYAMLAGLPPVVGLYASILPLVAYAVFGTSRTLAVGPVAVVSLLTASAAGEIAASGSTGYVMASLILALASGMILLLMGLLRLGFIANLLSHPVISGFITASAIIIALSQARHIFGISADGDSLTGLLPALVIALPGFDAITTLIGLASVGFLLWVRRGFRPLLMRLGLNDFLATIVARTGPVLAVIGSIALVAGLRLDLSGLAIVGDIPQGLPPLTLPSFDSGLWASLLPAAFLISIVGFVESISVAQTLAARRRQSIDPDQELIGLGAANITAGLSGGYPVTGGFARSVVNFDAGAQTPAAGALTAIGILIASLVLTPLLFYLPIAVLAATIIVAVLGLVDVKAIRETWRYSKPDFLAMAATIIATLGLGVEMGLIAGVTLSILLYLHQTSRPHVAVVGQVPGTEHFRNVDRHEVVTSEKVLTLRFDESLYFANARAMEDRVQREVARRSDLQHVVLQCPAVNFIDASALESLELVMHRLESSGIKLHLSEVKGPVMDRLKRSDLLDELTGRVFLSQHQAMRTLDPEATARADAGTRPEIAT